VDPRLPVYLRLAELDDERFVDWVYRVALQREPDEDGRESALTRLRERELSRPALIAELVASEDFAATLALEDAVAAAARARREGERLRELTGPPELDERVVELPWVLSRYHLDEHVLDVGYAFAEPAYLLGLLELGADRLVGVDLAEPFALKGMETVRADIRSLPFKNESFDLAFCVSTLEHVGKDNSGYGVRTLSRGGMESALRELRRVLTGRGRLLISVPTGTEEDHGWFVQHEPARWLELFGHAGFHVPEHEVYEVTAEGWRAAADEAVTGLAYGDRGKAASAVLCAELHVNADVGPSMRERVRSLTHRS
jgi:SAM-dependent methyltransferase